MSNLIPTSKTIKQKSALLLTLKRGSVGIATIQITRSTGEKSRLRAAIIKKAGISQIPALYFTLAGRYSLSIRTDLGQSVAVITVK